jgi:hypothetical protein
MKAIPTTYNGVNMRSRLEARWAAFFDVVGWRWEYEPPERGGWIPDFLLIGAKQTVAVEVKPIEWCGDKDAMVSQAKGFPGLQKVKDYNFATAPIHTLVGHEDVLVLGSYRTTRGVERWRSGFS